MRAAIIREHGGPEKVRVENVPPPRITTPDEVLIKVRACALNRLDVFVRRGVTGPGLRSIELPRITGVDVAGEVVSVGTGVTAWHAGDRVVVYSSLSCGDCVACARGEDSMCRHYRIFGEDVDGGLAEFCVVNARNLEALPPHITFADAAATPVAYTTAWRGLKVAAISPEHRVLVLGAGGGVGSAAVQLARRVGAFVIAVTGGRTKVAALEGLGANVVIDRDKDAFEEVVQRVTNGLGVDIVINPVGGATFRPAVRSLAMGGRMTLCGATIGDSPEVSLRELYQAHRQVIGAPMGSRKDLRTVLDLLYRGEISPAVGLVLPLDEIQHAHRQLEAGTIFGKIVIEVSEN